MKSKFSILNYKFFWLTVFLISHFSFLISAQSAYAHVLKSDGSIGAVLHISPEDDPIAGEQTSFFFELKDKNNKFKPENCDCNGMIIQGGKEIYSAPLFQDSTDPSFENASFSFTFPEKDIYKVKITGKPMTAGDFEPFELVWDLRVARESDGQVLNNNSNLYLVGCVIAAIIVGFFLKKGGVKKNEK